ncbi:uncharacterized protein DFL_005735 [Arthrobotrys flagrans]|uniref:Uncharacterized protein n=1 Tax=Arthrobotrys flagrans TaxID=97331 RepID=A0A436ZY83_ARTFL|nr:hypothetical protein DFL_005735 [Arthrobotrys flagrans]
MRNGSSSALTSTNGTPKYWALIKDMLLVKLSIILLSQSCRRATTSNSLAICGIDIGGFTIHTRKYLGGEGGLEGSLQIAG